MLTPTAEELLNSIPFARKRISDLVQHESVLFWAWESGRLTKERYFELYDSTHGLRLWWEERLLHLIKIKNAKRSRKV